jgi:hypothetical protein
MSEPTQFAAPHHLKGNMEGGSAPVSYGTDDGFIVTFREDTKHMEYLSQQMGCPIYRSVIMTNLIAPGNTKTVWDHETAGIAYEMAVDPESGEVHTTWEVMEACENGDVPEPVKYPKAWARFLKKNTAVGDGWPIEEWGVLSKTYAQSLKAQNVHSVQALAALTDQNAQNIMGAIKYRDLAKAALDERQKTRLLSKEQEKAARAEEQVSLLSKQVNDLKELVMRLEAERSHGGAPLPPAGTRTAAEHQAIAPQLKELSVTKAKQRQAKRAHAPGRETEAA